MPEAKKTALLPLQTATFSRLNGSMSCEVYDEVPQGAVFPYVAIGDDTSVAAGTKLDHGEDITQTLHFWSRKPGMAECKGLMNEAAQYLTQAPLAVAGFQFGFVRIEYQETFRDPDGVTRHGVMRLRFRVYQA